MGCDQALLISADPRPALRLYAWDPPALSLGWFQPLQPFVESARAAGLPIVRRPTGGGAIHHDQELTFCVAATPGSDGYPADVVEGYRWVHGIIRLALQELGAELSFRGDEAPLSVRPERASLCFEDATALDLVDSRGRKLVGSAQRRRGGRVLHHGSIPLSVPDLSPGSGALDLACGRPVSWDELAETLTRHFATNLGSGILCPSSLDQAENDAADSFAHSHHAEAGGRSAMGG
jgi:lipoate-protein ligase A